MCVNVFVFGGRGLKREKNVVGCYVDKAELKACDSHGI